jgi:predicted amidohydrolase YtcJ
MASDPADLIVRNARLFAGGDPRTAAEFPAWMREGAMPEDAPTALAAADGRIVWSGTDREADAFRGPRTEVIDARGTLVTPGFEDAHVHLELGARSLAEADLSGAATIDALAGALRDWRAAHPTASWVVGRGWQYGLFPGGMPDRALLDRLVPDLPAMLECFDGHTHWLNSAALAAAGITAATAQPRHGTIERDATGEPTGILKEFAHELLDDVIPRGTEGELDALFRDAFAHARRLGITALQDAWTEPADLRRLARLRDRGDIGLRVRVATPADEAEWHGGLPIARRRWAAALDAYAAALAGVGVDAWLRGGVVKAFADGVVESGTAWMLEPYEGLSADDDGARGRPTWTPDALAAMTSVAVGRGWQVEIHAIGDRAIRAALDAHATAAVETGQHPDGRTDRGRVEHVEWPDPADVARFAQLGVIASIQPTHALPIPHKLEVREQRIGARVRRGWPTASLLRSGALVAFGSDWPIATIDPLRQILAAVTRRDPDSHEGAGWLPRECLTLAEALACATWGSAAAGRSADRRGTLAPGMDADLVVLDRDVLADGVDSLSETRVAVTIVAGRVVYRAADR